MNLGAMSVQNTCGTDNSFAIAALRRRAECNYTAPARRRASLAWALPALSTSFTDSTALLAHRSFVRFWIARLTGGFANQMQAVAVGWQVYALTGSALDLGLVGLAQFLPSVVLLLVVGHVADRYDRRHIVGLCQLI